MPANEVTQYRGRPVEAVQLRTDNIETVRTWLKGHGVAAFDQDGALSFGHSTADVGDWIVLRDSSNPRVLTTEAFTAEFEEI